VLSLSCAVVVAAADDDDGDGDGDDGNDVNDGTTATAADDDDADDDDDDDDNDAYDDNDADDDNDAVGVTVVTQSSQCVSSHGHEAGVPLLPLRVAAKHTQHSIARALLHHQGHVGIKTGKLVDRLNGM
jgi:hypothetical protein